MDIHVEGMTATAYAVTIGSHRLMVDQPVAEGGTDRGPSPTDLFVAGLAGCAAYYAGRFLSRRGVDPRAVRCACSYHIAESKPARVEWVRLTLRLPEGLPDEVRAAALRAAEHCTVHNSLLAPPAVEIALAEALAAA